MKYERKNDKGSQIHNFIPSQFLSIGTFYFGFITFYFGSGTIIIYVSGSAKAKSYCSYGSGSVCLPWSACRSRHRPRARSPSATSATWVCSHKRFSHLKKNLFETDYFANWFKTQNVNPFYKCFSQRIKVFRGFFQKDWFFLNEKDWFFKVDIKFTFFFKYDRVIYHICFV